MLVAKDYFYTDDPMPFVKSESVDNLQMLLECIESIGKSKYLQIAYLCFYNTNVFRASVLLVRVAT